MDLQALLLGSLSHKRDRVLYGCLRLEVRQLLVELTGLDGTEVR